MKIISSIKSFTQGLWEKIAKIYHQIKGKFLAIVKKLKDTIKLFNKRILDIFSGEYYGMRLLKPYRSTSGYMILVVILFVVMWIIPFDIYRYFSYINLTEQNIAIVTVMLTVLLSAGFVFLGDDTKGWSLARITIIRDVVKLRGLIIAVLLICTVSVLPEITIHGHTLKKLSAPILIASYLFILSIFLRIYRWLSDLAADPRLFDSDADSESRTFPSKSYRFARIVYLIRHNNRRDVWQSILERRIPDGYEEFIHQEFFKASEEMVRSGKTEKLQELSFLLEIYEKYYKLRNLESWRFEFEYLGKFLSLYDKVFNILNVDRPYDVKLAVLWRGNAALERVIAVQTKALMSGHKVYSLFTAMDEYVDRAGLINPKNQRKAQTKVLSNFIDTLLDTIYDADDMSSHDVQSWVDSKENWQITYKGIFEDKNNVVIQLWKRFDEWLYGKLDLYDQRPKEKREYILVLDGIIELLFPEVDPIDFSRMYWFRYNAKNTTDSKYIAKIMHESDRPFGHIGRTDIEMVRGDKDEALRHFTERQNELQLAGVKLFAHLSANYFRSGFWNINEIIDELKQIIKDNDDDGDDNVQNTKVLIQDLESIKKELKL